MSSHDTNLVFLDTMLIHKDLHPPKQTWNLKMDPWKRLLLETIISRFHVNFWGCIHPILSPPGTPQKLTARFFRTPEQLRSAQPREMKR